MGLPDSTKVESCFVRLPTQADQDDLSVMTELDIWRSANILLKRYGAEAVFIATKRADALLDQGGGARGFDMDSHGEGPHRSDREQSLEKRAIPL